MRRREFLLGATGLGCVGVGIIDMVAGVLPPRPVRENGFISVPRGRLPDDGIEPADEWVILCRCSASDSLSPFSVRVGAESCPGDARERMRELPPADEFCAELVGE